MNIQILENLSPPTATEILEIEKVLGIRLNSEYVDFLRCYNGGKPECNIFPIPDGNESTISRFIPFYKLPTEADSFRRELGPYVIPIAYDDCGSYICVSNEKNDGEIYFWDHEYPEGQALIKLAPSLTSFLDMVHPFDASQITLEPGQVKSVWVSPELLKK